MPAFLAADVLEGGKHFGRRGRDMRRTRVHQAVAKSRDDSARRLFPIRPVSVREAIARALQNEDSSHAQTRWSDALSAAANAPRLYQKTEGRNLTTWARNSHPSRTIVIKTLVRPRIFNAKSSPHSIIVSPGQEKPLGSAPERDTVSSASFFWSLLLCAQFPSALLRKGIFRLVA
jgi:hypothetical protein